MSIEPFRKLVKLAARAFYDDYITTNGGKQPNTGVAVILIDALTRREWVREEQLGEHLKLHSKQLRQTLRFLEEEKLITRDHRRETGSEGEGKKKMHTQSYCCLDYAQIYDMVRYRQQKMKKKIKDELDNKNAVQEYICPICSKRYTTLDALRLISPQDGNFHCEYCNGELVAESDKLAPQDMGQDNARRPRREKLADMLQKMDVQLKPLMDQLAKVKDFPVPQFGTLHSWELQNIAGRANGEVGSNVDPSKSSQGLGFEVSFSDKDEKGEDIKPNKSMKDSTKVLPPWMIRQGMNLTAEQRGEVMQEIKMEGTSELSDEKKSKPEKADSTTNIQEEYYKAYYAAMIQQEAGNSNVDNVIFKRQVGRKSKREDAEGDKDFGRGKSAPAVNMGESCKVHDLKVQTEDFASGENDDDDDIDWEEG